ARTIPARNPRPSRLVREVRGQAGPAGPAMAAARALRPHLSASAARSGGIGPSTPQDAGAWLGLARAVSPAGSRGNQGLVAVDGADVDSGKLDRRVGLSRPTVRSHRQWFAERFRHRADARDLRAARPRLTAGALRGATTSTGSSTASRTAAMTR